MRPLSTIDTVFLSVDTQHFPMHATGALVLDPSTAPEPVTFDRVREHIRRFLPTLVPLRSRLVPVPFGLDTPVWVEDPDFDLDNHLHHLAVPPPGGDRELADLLGDLGTPALDFDRPLWDGWFVEQLEGGRVAVILKVHHACLDGMGGIEMLLRMFTASPDAVPQYPAHDPWRPEPVPSQLAMLRRATPRMVLWPLRSSRSLFRLATGVTRMRGARGSAPGPATAKLFRVPRVSFNRVEYRLVHRKSAWTSVPMDEVREIRTAFDATVNDVGLALCSGAIRAYLDERGELPDEPLTSANPVNLRRTDETGHVGNRVALMTVRLETHIADPVERLRAIAASTTRAKAATGDAGANMLEELFAVLTPGAAAFLFHTAVDSLGQSFPPPYSVCITNMVGPPTAPFFCGARLEHFIVQMMQAPGMGLIIALVSHGGKLELSVTGSREVLPDPWAVADGIVQTHRQLRTAARELHGRDAPAGTGDPAPAPAPARGASPAPAGRRATVTTADAVALVDDAVASFVAACDGATGAEWVFTPASGTWSMAEVTEHVAVANRGVRSVLSRGLRPLAPGERPSVRDDEVPHLFERPGDPPDGTAPTGTWTDPAGALDELERSARDLLDWVRTTNADLRAGACEHPRFGLMDGVQWLLFAAAHTGRHRAELPDLRGASRAG